MIGEITKSDAAVTEPRWKCVIMYRADSGPIDVTHDVDELYEIHDLVERGPHWDAIEKIEITLAARNYENLTIEQAEEL